MFWTNYHSHSHFSDGKENLIDFVLSAIDNNFASYGFTEHAPVDFTCEWTMPLSELHKYLKEIDELKARFKSQISLLKSLEVDYIPGKEFSTLQYINSLNLDYIVGSIHFVDCFDNGENWNIDTSKALFEKGLSLIFENNAEKLVKRFYQLTAQMVAEMKPDIIGHLDKICMFNENSEYFSTKENWYQKEIDVILSIIAQSSSVLELNTRGFYKGNDNGFCPPPDILYKAKKHNIPVTICSDSHHPTEIKKGYSEAVYILKDVGYSEVCILDGEWKNAKICPEGFFL